MFSSGPLLVLLGALVRCNAFNWENNKYFLAFGDSYTFVQGTSGELNFSFIGDAFNLSATPRVLFETEIVNNDTSSGGSNWVEFLTGCFSGLPAECENQLWDFAYAGADISSKFLPPHHNTSIQLDQQVRQWDAFAREPLAMDPETTLVAFFIGINDIDDSASFTNVSFPAFYDTIISTYFDSVELVHSRGFKNFLFLGLPPLDKTPGNLGRSNPVPNITMIEAYDSSLEDHVDAFQAAHPEATTVLFDTYSTLSAILEDPESYGITNTTSFCPRYDAPDIATNFAAYGCDPIAEYFWYNSGHITFTVHQVLAGSIDEELRARSTP